MWPCRWAWCCRNSQSVTHVLGDMSRSALVPAYVGTDTCCLSCMRHPECIYVCVQSPFPAAVAQFPELDVLYANNNSLRSAPLAALTKLCSTMSMQHRCIYVLCILCEFMHNVCQYPAYMCRVCAVIILIYRCCQLMLGTY